MSPRTKKQFEVIRQNRKDSIMETAIRLFAANGFDSVTISTIAKEAGVSKGLMYNYFENKEMLLKEIIIEGMKRMMAELDVVHNRLITRDMLIALIDKNFKMMKTDRHYWQLYIAVISQPRVMGLVKEEMLSAINPFLTMISNYYKTKGVDNPIAYTFLIGSLMDGIALDYVLTPDEYPLDEVRNLIVEKLL